MKITVDACDMKRKFEAFGRDYYTFKGLEMLLDFYNEIDKNMELDVIRICRECTEYGNGALLNFKDLKDEYEFLYSVEEWLEDNELEEDKFDNDKYITALVEHIEEEATVLHVPNGNYIVFHF